MTSRGSQSCKNHFAVKFVPTDIAKYEYLYVLVTQYASGFRKFKKVYMRLNIINYYYYFIFIK